MEEGTLTTVHNEPCRRNRKVRDRLHGLELARALMQHSPYTKADCTISVRRWLVRRGTRRCFTRSIWRQLPAGTLSNARGIDRRNNNVMPSAYAKASQPSQHARPTMLETVIAANENQRRKRRCNDTTIMKSIFVSQSLYQVVSEKQ